MTWASALSRAGIAIAAIALTVYQYGIGHTVDSERLQKRPRPRPFNLRWLLPTLLRGERWAWMSVTWPCLVGTVMLFPGDVWAAALWCCMPWFRYMANVPVNTDSSALCAVLGSRRAPTYVLVALGALGGAITERTPVWMGLVSWRPEPLYLGLCVVLVMWKWTKSVAREGPPALKVGRAQSMRWTDGARLLLPWGAGLAALLFEHWTMRDVAIVVVAYGQMLTAWDTVRMFQWSAPIVLPKAVAIIPARWMPMAVVATWFNPWASARSKGQVMT